MSNITGNVHAILAENYPGVDPQLIKIINDFMSAVSSAMLPGRGSSSTGITFNDNIGDITIASISHGTAINILPRRIKNPKSALILGVNGAIVASQPVLVPRADGTVDVYVWFNDSTTKNKQAIICLLSDGIPSNSIPTFLEAIPKSILTSTGGIIYASAPGVPAFLPPGSNGQVLTLAAGVPSWAAGGGGGQVDFIQTRRWGMISPSGTTGVNPIVTGLQAITLVGTPNSGALGERDFAGFGGAIGGATAGITGPYSEIRPTYRPKFSIVFALDTRAGKNVNARHWFGISNNNTLANLAPIIGSAASAIVFIGVAFDSTISGNLIIDTGDGANHSGINSGVTVPVNTITYFRVVLDWTTITTLAWSISSEPWQSGVYNQALEVWTAQASGNKTTNLSVSATQDMGIHCTGVSSALSTINLAVCKLMLEQN